MRRLAATGLLFNIVVIVVLGAACAAEHAKAAPHDALAPRAIAASLPAVPLGSCDGTTAAVVPARPPSAAGCPQGAEVMCAAFRPMGQEETRQLAAWLNGAELPGDPTAPRPVVDDALRAHGASLFAAHCATCHGAKGDGLGPLAPELAIAPRDFTRGVYALRTTPTKSLPSDEDLFRTISRGIHGTSMVPWVTLSETDRWALVAHLETLSPEFADDEAEPPVVVPDAPPITPELLAAGHAIYDKAGCKDCHGPDGHGDGAAAAMLRDPTGRPVVPRDFTASRFWRGGSMPAIWLTLETGLDGTPMGSYAKVLAPADVWAVAAYVHGMGPRAGTAGPGGIHCPDAASTHPEELAGASAAFGALP